jgi:Cdc6-like AAA superfamily ATPase
MIKIKESNINSDDITVKAIHLKNRLLFTKDLILTEKEIKEVVLYLMDQALISLYSLYSTKSRSKNIKKALYLQIDNTKTKFDTDIKYSDIKLQLVTNRIINITLNNEEEERRNDILPKEKDNLIFSFEYKTNFDVYDKAVLLLKDSSDIIGREKEENEMKDFISGCIRNNKSGYLGINGSPGIGKTTIIHQFLNRFKNEF